MIASLRTFLPAAVLLTASMSAHADFDRTLTVSPQVDLYVSTGSGHVHIVPGSDSQVHIKARVHAGWNAGGDTEDRIRQINQNPPIRQSGNEVHVGDVSSEDRRLYNNITIDYEISAPRAVALNLRSGSGDLDADNLSRFLKADTGSGSIHAKGITGPAELRTGSGDIELQQNSPGEIKASTGSGSIRVSGSSPADRSHHLSTALNGGGPTLEARTGSGDIEIN